MSENLISESEQIEALRLELDALGISYHHKAGIEKLRELYLGATNDVEAAAQNSEGPIDTMDPMRLIRVIVYNNDPEKREYTGDYFQVMGGGHKAARFVPFGNAKGWHIEKMLYEFLEEKQIQLWKTVKDPRTGVETSEAYQSPAFTIKVLDNLSQKELKELALDQANRHAVA